LDIKEKTRQLYELYRQFETASQPYISSAVCKPGCADCCTTVGNVDITTLEGLIILRHLQSCPPALQKDLSKRLKLNRKEKMESKYARCAFLDAANRCAIYTVRPFSCRRLYSVKPCGETGPTVHRQVWEMAENIVSAIQVLDSNGYSGHLSYVLQLLNDARFKKIYLNDQFFPDEIKEFAQKHALLINRFTTTPEK
jgi:Fe-S-cluster containining protein